MRKIFISIILFILSANIAFAQQDPQITFPIAELGNCNNAQTCKVYCDQEENREACIAFAKSKGLYKTKVNAQKATALSFAKIELGCDSIASCKALCEKKEDQQKCKDFAIKHGLGSPKPEEDELLAKAKQNLNCDSFEECKALCDQQDNYTKCAALLQDQITSDDKAMFDKYKDTIRQYLGCDSIVTCMAFCINPLNSAKCNELGSKIGGSEQIPNQESPEVWCPKVSSECKWDGTNCVCNGPQTCSQSNDIPGCTWDGTQCNCPGTNTEESPELWCPKAGPGCAWDGQQCFCPGSDSPTGSEVTQPTQEPGDVWCPKIGPYCVWDGSSCTCWDDCVKAGGTWTGSRCDLPPSLPEQDVNQNYSEPQSVYPTLEPGEVWCPRNPDCKWTGETCLCAPVQLPQTEPTPTPAVQGVTTNHDLLQQIFDFIRSL